MGDGRYLDSLIFNPRTHYSLSRLTKKNANDREDWNTPALKHNENVGLTAQHTTFASRIKPLCRLFGIRAKQRPDKSNKPDFAFRKGKRSAETEFKELSGDYPVKKGFIDRKVASKKWTALSKSALISGRNKKPQLTVYAKNALKNAKITILHTIGQLLDWVLSVLGYYIVTLPHIKSTSPTQIRRAWVVTDVLEPDMSCQTLQTLNNFTRYLVITHYDYSSGLPGMI